MPVRTDPPSKKSATLSSDQKVLDWWGQYVNSPKYKQRLSAFYQYPEHVQRKRSALANTMSVRENPGTASRYYEEDNQIAYSDIQAQAAKSSREDVLSHEAAHSVNRSKDNRALALAPAESKYIMERNKQVSTATRQRFENIAKEGGKPISEYLTDENHDISPAENHSDINAFRHLLKKRGLYDAGKDDISPEVLKKAMRDDVIKRSFILKRLKESFDDKGLIEIMNKVASNKNPNKSNTA